MRTERAANTKEKQMNNDYQYSGLPLKPRSASELILQIFMGQEVERKFIVSTITELHQSRGGKLEDKNYTNTFKSALRYLQGEGKAKSLTNEGGPKGCWQIGSSSDFSSNKKQGRHMDSDYKPLKYRLASELILDEFTGQKVEKKEIVRTITELHRSRGGTSRNYPGTISKALGYLEGEGKAKSLLKEGGPLGYWQIGSISDFSKHNKEKEKQVKSDYKYSGLPLKSPMASELILEIFTGQKVERKFIVSTITELHRNRGGTLEGKNHTTTIKSALGRLKKEGKAKSLFEEGGPLGYWQIGSISDFSSGNQQENVEMRGSPIGVVDKISINEFDEYEKIIGTGEGAVYLFYHENDRHRAESEGKSRWPCKIGMTERDPLGRVKAQTATATPTPPKTYVFRTDVPNAMEKLIHAMLDACGKRVKSSGGKEWFDTSPGEVESIYMVLTGIIAITSKTV